MAIKKQLKDKDGNTIYPDVGLNLDDVVYSDDPESVGDDYIDPASYSTDEKKTGGTWIDGKPIYKKTIVLTFSSVPAAGLAWNHGISNFSKMIAHDIVFNLGWDRTFYGDSAYLARKDIQLRVGATQIVLDTVSANNWAGTIYYTIYYTKTTD